MYNEGGGVAIVLAFGVHRQLCYHLHLFRPVGPCPVPMATKNVSAANYFINCNARFQEVQSHTIDGRWLCVFGVEWVICWVIDIMPMVPVVAHLMAKIVNGIWFGISDCNWVAGWLGDWVVFVLDWFACNAISNGSDVSVGSFIIIIIIINAAEQLSH